MFRKVHLRLTILFTTVCALILLIMSVLYNYLNYRNIRTNAYNSFQNDMNTFITNCENSTVITYDYLAKLENDERYSFYIYDNNVPYNFVANTKSKQDLELVSSIRTYYQEHYKITPNSRYTSYHTEFFYPNHSLFCVGVGIIPGDKSNLELIVLYSSETVYAQLQESCLQFLFIVLISIIAIWIFSWHYTKHLLNPIEENQLKQMQFISSASHELRTPVATILSALSAMEKGSEQEKEEFSMIAKKEGERLSLLVDDMLSLARSDNHTFSMHVELAEPDTLLLDSYEAFLAPAREKEISLYITLPEEKISLCKMDPVRIKQVLAILISNATSYTKRGGLIRLSLQETAKDIRFTVADNGIGIPDMDKPHIFDRFYRVDSSRNSREHFGLGLSIAKEIIDAYIGTITVSDTPGGGSTFIISLPL